MSNTGSTAAEGRTARMERTTSESSVLVEINLDGTGVSDISTSVPFYDHLLTALAKHSLTDLTVRATGDTDIDVHHTVEDIAISFGDVRRTALGNKSGIPRYGDAPVPLDEALAQAVVDISGRPYLVHAGEPAGHEYHLIGGHFTGLDDAPRLRGDHTPRGDFRAHHGHGRARRPPHRRGTVQGVRARAPRRR